MVSLERPDMCLSCRFCRIVPALHNGVRQDILHCKRLDCDNWMETTEENANIQFLRPDGGDEGPQKTGK